MNLPRIVTVTRKKNREPFNLRRSSIRELSREYFKIEHIWCFVVELLLFGLLVTVSAWPMIQAVEAMQTL